MTDMKLLEMLYKFRSLQQQVIQNRRLAEVCYMNHMHELSWAQLFERELTRDARAEHWQILRDHYPDAVRVAEE